MPSILYLVLYPKHFSDSVGFEAAMEHAHLSWPYQVAVKYSLIGLVHMGFTQVLYMGVKWNALTVTVC